MTNANNALRVRRPTTHTIHEQTRTPAWEAEAVQDRSEPKLVRPPQGGSRRDMEPSLRMYTEEQVANMLQVSLSQLRKWRIKKYVGRRGGPPYRKIGRLVRYPEAALRDYINSEQSNPPL
jgi:transposase-like protein